MKHNIGLFILTLCMLTIVVFSWWYFFTTPEIGTGNQICTKYYGCVKTNKELK